MSPSLRHELLAWAVPRVRKSRDLEDVDVERARIERWHRTLDRTLPTRLVPRFDRRFAVEVEDAGGFPTYVILPQGAGPYPGLVLIHGGAFMAPLDPFHVRFAARLSTSLRARIVMPDYPLAPEHTWRDSFGQVTDLTERWCKEPGGTVLYGDSAGGGYARAVAIALRDRGGAQPTRMLLHSPWVDLSTSTVEETAEAAAIDPWLFLGKLRAYAEWWAGSPEDLDRPEVSPALADLADLPPTLMFCGTRDLLVPGCRLLARRAVEAGWPLTYVEVPDLIHVYPLLPFIPEAGKAWRQTLGFLR